MSDVEAAQHYASTDRELAMLAPGRCFGMICRELGYVVEIVKPGFPDCEAKREVRPGMWQRVRIEFEFRCRTFYSHGHDPDQCDVIVCWEDNWPNCPIEVLELKSLSGACRPQ